MPAPASTLEAFGAMVRRARDARRLSQDDLGELLGQSQSWVSDLETGALRRIDAGLMVRLSTTLGLPIDAEVTAAAAREAARSSSTPAA